MRKVLVFSLLSNIPIFAQGANNSVAEPMSISLLWLILSLLIVGLFFWAIYKLMTTKNPKYGYVLLLSGVLMVASIFI